LKIYRLSDKNNNKKLLKELNVQGAGVSIMSKKMQLYIFQIKDMSTPALNILKQDALSIGAELAVPSGVITCEKSSYDAILIGNKKHIEILSKKELAQPFGLKTLAKELKKYLLIKSYPIQIMGVINANSDSFFNGSRFQDKNAIDRCLQMIEDGAEIIDIGGVSSRPNADIVSQEEELKRVQPICDMIKSQKLYKKAIFSIDSYSPKVIEYALNCGFKIINDITGAKDEKVIKLAVKYGVKLSIMHMQGDPQNMQNNPQYNDIITEVGEFFEQQIIKCEELGLDRESIILDVGIGFGKTLNHNLRLIKNLKEFTKFGCEVLIGASRKSMIDMIIPTPIEERLAGTIAIHLESLNNGANIIRCHDVKEHKQAIEIHKAIGDCS